VCTITFKQNLGHLGNQITIEGFHGHRMTMKFEWPEVHAKVFDELADRCKQFNTKFLCGDFNMSVTEVVKQLRSRGLRIELAAWYPWMHETIEVNGSGLGFDSCAMFYIGGDAEVQVLYSMKDYNMAAVAGDDYQELRDTLDRYEGQNTPGKHWACYHSRKKKEAENTKDLSARLNDLHSPDPDVYLPPKRHPRDITHYLRLKQKKMDKEEWLVKVRRDDGSVETAMHNGAHMPLCVFSKNTRARSMKAEERRKHKYYPDTGWQSRQMKPRVLDPSPPPPPPPWTRRVEHPNDGADTATAEQAQWRGYTWQWMSPAVADEQLMSWRRDDDQAAPSSSWSNTQPRESQGWHSNWEAWGSNREPWQDRSRGP